MTLRNTLIATAIAALGASAWAQAPTSTDPLKKPATPALGAPASPGANKAPEKLMPKHEKHASKATHKQHARKAHPKQDMHKANPEPAHSS